MTIQTGELPLGRLPQNTADRTAIRAHELRKVYGHGDTAVAALDGVSVDFGVGRFTAIMGPSGSGKSTLMHCLAYLDTPTSGQVLLGETELTQLPDPELTRIRRDRIGFVFQSFNLLPMLSAKDNILLPLELGGRKPDQQWMSTLIDVLGLEDRLTHRPSELSGGQQQRVAVARALVEQARGGLRRRADRQPGLEVRCRGARLPAPLGPGVRPDRGDGHPRPAGGVVRRPRGDACRRQARG